MKRIRFICMALALAACMAGCAGGSGQNDERGGGVKEKKQDAREEAGGQEGENGQVERLTASGRIVCWGDSLTYGFGGDGVTYPSVLKEKIDAEVLNYGNSGETARQIGMRIGVFPMEAGEFSLPAGTAPVAVPLLEQGEDPRLMRYQDSAINPCLIDGVEGTLSFQAETGRYLFSRSEPGEARIVEAGARVETFASKDKDASDIVILFAGTNLPPSEDTVDELIAMEREMLAYLGTERYVVIGLTSKELIPDVEPINEALAEAFGEHFLDIRAYLLENGLNDAGISPTGQDERDLAAGEIPSSLRIDEVHGNAAFYRIIGEQACLKLEELGYVCRAGQ